MMPGLSLCIIAKNEQDFLEQCINSVKMIADEIIVTDTGSSDKTKEIAEKLGAKVYDFKWCDDFSAAKNFCASKASHEWILFLDADEAVSGKDLQALKELANNKDADGFAFKMRNYFKENIKTQKATNDQYNESKDYAGWHEAEIIRLFRNKKEIYFSSIIHESVADSIRKFKGIIKQAGIPIHHFGYALKKRSEEKTEKYIKMQEKQIQQTPHSPKPYYELGAIYLKQNNYEKAIASFEKAEHLLETQDKLLLIHQYLYHDLGKAYFKTGNFEKAKQAFEKAEKTDKNNYSTQFFLGLIHDENNKYPDAVKHYEASITINPQNPSALRNLGIIYLKHKNHKKAYEVLLKAFELEPDDELLRTIKTLQKKLGIINNLINRNI
ncbi:tetratricopeptide repeat protein [Candidatus Woesearchaeota archaeon]|nr:tetratricopeptide repeat protein [Candidatus Woesearchaeota archaeon]